MKVRMTRMDPPANMPFAESDLCVSKPQSPWLLEA
jgi:hypothetical protein